MRAHPNQRLSLRSRQRSHGRSEEIAWPERCFNALRHLCSRACIFSSNHAAISLFVHSAAICSHIMLLMVQPQRIASDLKLARELAAKLDAEKGVADDNPLLAGGESAAQANCAAPVAMEDGSPVSGGEDGGEDAAPAASREEGEEESVEEQVRESLEGAQCDFITHKTNWR